MSSTKRKAPVEERPNKKSKSAKSSSKGDDTKPAKFSKSQEHSSDRKPVAKSVLIEEERAFPRGGASVLTPLEERQIKAQADRDVLFEQHNGQLDLEDDAEGDLFDQRRTRAPTNAKSKSKSHREKTNETKSIEKKGIPTHGLSFKNLVVGTSVLGCVTAVTNRDIALALPNNITGYIPITSISDILNARIDKLINEASGGEDEDADEDLDVDLKQLFHHGQWLRALVTATTSDTAQGEGKSKRHIELTVDPRHINAEFHASDLPPNSMVQATVRSVEDHGVVMDLGLSDSSVKGFVSKKELGAAFPLEHVQPGQVMMCLVTGKGSDGKILKLSPDAARFSVFSGGKNGPSLHEAPTINAFQPGTGVDILIVESSGGGVVGKIMGMVDVTADLLHTTGGSTMDLSKDYKVGSKTKARIIWTLPKDDNSRHTGVSLLEHLLVLPPPADKLAENASAKLKSQSAELQQRLPLSLTVENAKITSVLQDRGVFMELPLGTDNPKETATAFANLAQMSDKPLDALSSTTGPYKTGSLHKARIMAYNPIDNTYYVALRQSILDQPFLRLEDLVIGGKIKATVEKLILGARGVTGVLVKLSDNLMGLIPEVHLSDAQLHNPERKFKEGHSVQVRVLSVNLEKRQVRLTAKKSLVNDENTSVWDDYAKLEPGMENTGVVIKLLSSGAVVQFYGEVRAFLPVAEMSETYIERPEQHFRLGQTLKVRILSVHPETQEMKVSCKDEQSFSEEQNAAWDKIQGGELVSGIVTENTADSITLDLDNGIKGLVRLGHMADGTDTKASSALKKFQIGRTASELLVLGKLNRSRHLLVTKKASMVADAKANKLIRSFSDVQDGMQVHGFVRNVTPEGVYTEFANGVVGLLPKNQLSPDMLGQPAFGLLKDQTITAWVMKVDLAASRFVLSMRDQTASISASTTSRAPLAPLTNPVDPSLSTLADLSLGRVTKARIASVKSTQINVRLADNVQGRIDMSEAFDSWEDIQNKKCPLQLFKANQVLDVKILGIHDSKTHRFLPISHRHSTVPVYELTAKSSRVKDGDESALSLDSIQASASYIGFVNNHQESCIWASISPNVKGRIEVIDLSDRPGQLLDVSKHFPLGSSLKVKVKSLDLNTGRLNLTARSESEASLNFQDITPGMVLAGRITKITERSLTVHLADNVVGTVSLVDMNDDYDDIQLSQYQKNSIVQASVLEVDTPNKRIFLTLRPSKVLSSSLPVKDTHLTRYEQLKEGDLVRGFIQNISDRGVYIQLGTKLVAMVRITDLSDDYVKDWKSLYQVDQLVKGRVLFVDGDAKQIHMSLKSSHTDANYVPPLKIEDLKPGVTVTGKVRKVEDFGAFIDIDKTQPRLSGLCHRSEIAAQRIEDVRTLYSPGDIVKAKILKVDVGAKRISLGLKAAYFADELSDDEMESDEDNGQHNGVALGDGDASERDVVAMLDKAIEETDGSEDFESADEDQQPGDAMEIDGVTAPGLKTNGFDWTGNTFDQNVDGAVSDVEIDTSAPKKRKKHKPEIKEDLTGDLDKYGPRSVDDFERQLLGQPNDSQLWIQYMAFQLGLSEVQNARDIAERALRTMHIREQDEKANIWTAWLNLEVEYGDDDAVEEVFKKACQMQDSLAMHEKLASIYISSGKLDKADTIFEQIVANKAFRGSPDVWLNYANFLMDAMDAPVRARALLTRALQSIPTHEHRQLTAKFAALEFHSSHGDPERGRTIFEGLVSEWPKWTSGWDMFVDLERARVAHATTQEAREAAKTQVRGVYERIVAQKMKQRRAKFVFKRWLEFEDADGTPKTAARVKALATEYVERQQAASAEMDEE